jgi:Tol biopolymer transport system component
MFRKGFAAWILCAACLAAQTPSLEQSLSMKSVVNPQISPDGRYVAYSVQQANWDANDFVSQIWIAVTATGERQTQDAGVGALVRSKRA